MKNDTRADHRPISDEAADPKCVELERLRRVISEDFELAAHKLVRGDYSEGDALFVIGRISIAAHAPRDRWREYVPHRVETALLEIALHAAGKFYDRARLSLTRVDLREVALAWVKGLPNYERIRDAGPT